MPAALVLATCRPISQTASARNKAQLEIWPSGKPVAVPRQELSMLPYALTQLRVCFVHQQWPRTRESECCAGNNPSDTDPAPGTARYNLHQRRLPVHYFAPRQRIDQRADKYEQACGPCDQLRALTYVDDQRVLLP